MKNTEFTSNLLGTVISSEESLKALVDMMTDLDLEITSILQPL